MIDPLDSFDEFSSTVRARLEAGRSEYSGRPASQRPLSELADEILAELEDVAGWSACLWPRVRRLRRQAEHADVEHLATVRSAVDRAQRQVRALRRTAVVLGVVAIVSFATTIAVLAGALP